MTTRTTEHHVWRTRNDIGWTWVAGESVTDGLVRLARALDDFALEPYVTHLSLSVDDEGTILVGALTEMDR